jgi:peptidoglycan/xylan/chitin deacetylase (PgdA/CDA1 family)
MELRKVAATIISRYQTLTAEMRLGILLVFIVIVLAGSELAGVLLVPKPETPVPTPTQTKWARSSKEIDRGSTEKKQIILTFDGGDGTQSAEKILEALAKHQVKSTFFLTGNFVRKNQDLVRRIALSGHEIFNHSYSHPHLTELKDQNIVKELNRMDRILRAVLSASSSIPFEYSTSSHPYFRAPYGDRDERVIKAAFSAGYQSVYWTIDGRDWEETEGMSAAEVENLILGTMAPGNIYLMHVGDNITGDILDRLLTSIESRGYKVVSLTEGL